MCSESPKKYELNETLSEVKIKTHVKREIKEQGRKIGFFFFLNNHKSQTILLVGIVLKLFEYLTTRDQKTRF